MRKKILLIVSIIFALQSCATKDISKHNNEFAKPKNVILFILKTTSFGGGNVLLAMPKNS